MQTLDFGKRYDAKREAGISEIRSDGSLTSRETDVQAGAAEYFAAAVFGKICNTDIYSTHGDSGEDFRIGSATVEVVHLGMVNGSPRTNGNLIVNPHEPHRHADIYMVVSGSIQTKFEIIGWYSHECLLKRPKRTFGFGPRYWCPIDELYPIAWLLEAIESGS